MVFSVLDEMSIVEVVGGSVADADKGVS